MHEMSIAISIVEAVTEKTRQEGCTLVTEIDLVVGRLSGVQLESLLFCFSAAAAGTMAEQARLVVDEREGVGECEACGTRVAMETHYARCPGCGEFRVRIVSGEELSVQSITIE